MEHLVFKFGLLRPKTNQDIVMQQMQRNHDYRKALVAIECARRDAIRKIDAEHPDLSALYQAATAASRKLREVIDEVRLARKKAAIEDFKERRAANPSARIRGVRPEGADGRARIANARALAKTARNAWKEAKKKVAADTTATRARDEANEAAHRRRVEARGACNVYWGTYSLAEDAHASERTAPLWVEPGVPNNPVVGSWRGEGAVSVQIINGMPVTDLFALTSTQVQIDDQPGKTSGKFKRLRMRVASSGRDPVWAEWPMCMHRPFPDGAMVKRVTVHRRRQGPRDKWHVTFILAVDSYQTLPRGRGMIGIDIGWKMLTNGSIRVATSCDEAGVIDEVVVPMKTISGLSKSDSLRQIRDKNLAEFKGKLIPWLNKSKLSPEWISRIEDIARWKSQARFALLVTFWDQNRIADDDHIFAEANKWRRQDAHLWTWESDQRAKSINHRTNEYRGIAATLASTFDTLCVEGDLGLPDIIKRKKPEDKAMTEAEKQAATRRFIAAPGSFKMIVMNAFKMRSRNVIVVPAAGTSLLCNICDSSTGTVVANIHTCPNGHSWDRSENAAKNLIKRGREIMAKAAEIKLKKERRWDRARRLGRERDERMGEAL